MAKAKKAVDAAVDASRSVKSALNDLLDMSTEARKARAAEQGFDTDRVWYHGTGAPVDFEEFALVDGRAGVEGWFTDKPDLANDYARYRSGNDRVIPVYLKTNRIERMDKIRERADKEGIDRWSADFPKWVRENYDAIDNSSGGYRVVIPTSPSSIRSVNATFDPAKRESANLLAGLGGAAVLGASMEDAEAGKLGRTARSIDELQGLLTAKYDLKNLHLYESRNGDITLSSIIVDKDKRKQGIGSAVMSEINDYADAKGSRVVLSPAGQDDLQGTTSRNRLVKFYKGHGYIENKGRNKDFEISEGMYRNPSSNPQDESGFADPMTLAVTAAITGAATEFYRRRESKQSFWQQRREELSELINAGDEFIRPAMPYINSALEALDKPMQGYYGVASALGALVEGNGLDASLQRGATVARQPIEETAQEYGGVLADEGYPLAGTVLNTAMQVTGPF